jgi:endonuclease/exonuclease/phosphatase family metal-dependent hydrolase
VKRAFIGGLRLLALLLLGPWVVLFAALFWNDYTEIDEYLEDSAFLQSPPPEWKADQVIKIVTFNIQDLPFGTEYEDNPERMRAVAKELSSIDPDVAGFQESFSAKHRKILIDELRDHTRLQHFQYFGSGMVGSGLLTASAFPVVEKYFHRFTDSNAWYHVSEGDWWAGKGVSLSRLEVAQDKYLDYYNTHAQADYGRAANEAARLRQMEAAAAFVRRSLARTIPAIFAGDTNCRQGEPDYQALVTGADLTRTMLLQSGIDHIFAVNQSSYDIEVLSTSVIEPVIRTNDVELRLSDHPGFVSELNISPVDES